jgi:hypothetical protein
MADTAQSLPRGGQRGFGRAWPEYIGLYVPQTSVSDVGHRPARMVLAEQLSRRIGPEIAVDDGQGKSFDTATGTKE